MNMKINKSEIERMLEIVTNLSSIEVIEIKKTKAVIYLNAYNLTYELKKGDWSFVEALHIAFNIEIGGKYDKYYNNGNLQDIAVVSAYELMELRNALEVDKLFFNDLYKTYFYTNTELRGEAASKQYILDYIAFINRLSSNIEESA